MSAPVSSGLLPLAQRMRWTSGFRLVIAAAPVLVWLLLPAARGGSLEEVLAPAAGYGLVAVLGLAFPLLRLGRTVALTGLATGLLLDGVYLGWAFLVLGGLTGPVGHVMLVHATAVTLLLSFRTGLKLAVWHSMVLLVVLQVEVVGLAGDGRLTGQPFPTVGLASLLAVLWAATLTTATFAAVNERELRRRRYDVEVLLQLARRVESSTDVDQIAALLAGLVHEELLAERTLVLVHPNLRQRGELPGSSRTTTGTAVRRVGQRATETLRVPDSFPAGSLVAAAVQDGAPRLARRLDPGQDGWVAGLLPGAENLLVVPFRLDHQVAGALVMVAGRRGTTRRWRPRLAPRIERRRVATAQQATAHAAQALGRAALFRRLCVAADTDGLTGLANRRTFDRAMADQLRRGGGTPFGVLLVDLDYFKRVNDTLGHQAGDDTLRIAAAVLQMSCRDVDVAARYGGEEFAVLLPGLTPEDSVLVAERVRAALEQADGPARVTASIGVACHPLDGADPGSLLQQADAALYRAKAEGRNQVVAAWLPVLAS